MYFSTHNTQVRTNGRVTTHTDDFCAGQSMLRFENGHIYGFLKKLKKSITGCITMWQRMKIVPERPRPVAIPNSFVTIKCVERVRLRWHSNLSLQFDSTLAPCPPAHRPLFSLLFLNTNLPRITFPILLILTQRQPDIFFIRRLNIPRTITAKIHIGNCVYKVSCQRARRVRPMATQTFVNFLSVVRACTLLQFIITFATSQNLPSRPLSSACRSRWGLFVRCDGVPGGSDPYRLPHAQEQCVLGRTIICNSHART